MLFSEFQAGTNCRDNEHNHNVYRRLEVAYMNSDLTKEEIYTMAAPLLDNSKSAEQLRLEAEIIAEIDALRAQIETNKSSAAYYAAIGNKHMAAFYTADNKYLRGRIKALKWVLE